MIDKSVNAGSSAQNGFALQRNTALFLLLENYFDKFKDNKYFICLEHHDDFLFCFLNKNNEAESIEAYQSKKKAPDIWRANTELYKILNKLLLTGKNLITDDIKRSSSYKHFLYFSTNQTINLEHKPKKNENKPTISESIKADNSNVHFLNLPIEIQDKIKAGVSAVNLHEEFENINFIWIPLAPTVIEQENQLDGKIYEVFGNKINNRRSAVETLISLFTKIEYIDNQGNVAKLLDLKKRVSSEKIEETFRILTSKSKSFNYWHTQSHNIAKILQIKPIDKEIFELDFITSFELFKSIEEAEHRKILQFSKDNFQNLTTYTEEENVLELFTHFTKTQTSIFEALKLKAIFFAAYFEVTFKTENKL